MWPSCWWADWSKFSQHHTRTLWPWLKSFWLAFYCLCSQVLFFLSWLFSLQHSRTYVNQCSKKIISLIMRICWEMGWGRTDFWEIPLKAGLWNLQSDQQRNGFCPAVPSSKFNNCNSEGYLLACSYWASGIYFCSSVKINSIFGVFFVFQHSFYFPQLSSFQPVHLWQIQFLCPQKRGCLNPVRLFQGFTANGMATFSLAFVVQPEGVPSSNCLGNPV